MTGFRDGAVLTQQPIFCHCEERSDAAIRFLLFSIYVDIKSRLAVQLLQGGQTVYALFWGLPGVGGHAEQGMMS